MEEEYVIGTTFDGDWITENGNVIPYTQMDGLKIKEKPQEKHEDEIPLTSVYDSDTDSITLLNTDDLHPLIEKVYLAIIKALMLNGYSNSSVANLLFMIPYVSYENNTIVIHVKHVGFFEKIMKRDIVEFLKENITSHTFEVEIKEFKPVNISDYFLLKVCN